MSASVVGSVNSESYPIGSVPAVHVPSLNDVPRQLVPVGARADVPLRYRHDDPDVTSVVSLVAVVFFDRQLPPTLLSRAGLINSIEYPGASPTVGHGKPAP